MCFNKIIEFAVYQWQKSTVNLYAGYLEWLSDTAIEVHDAISLRRQYYAIAKTCSLAYMNRLNIGKLITWTHRMLLKFKTSDRIFIGARAIVESDQAQRYEIHRDFCQSTVYLLPWETAKGLHLLKRTTLSACAARKKKKGLRTYRISLAVKTFTCKQN